MEQVEFTIGHFLRKFMEQSKVPDFIADELINENGRQAFFQFFYKMEENIFYEPNYISFNHKNPYGFNSIFVIK